MFDDPLRTIAILHVSPAIEDGRFPIKREVGDVVAIEADIFKDGHDLIEAAVLVRANDSAPWEEVPMVRGENDRWHAEFHVHEIGSVFYTVLAWVDRFGSWLDEIRKKTDANEDVASELLEGEQLVGDALTRCQNGTPCERLRIWLDQWIATPSVTERVQAVSDPWIVARMHRLADRSLATRHDRVYRVVVDRKRARFSSWYEMFPRSQGTDPNRSATLRDCAARVPEIHAMGFDVIYLPPVHPIGHTHRKGKNNALVAQLGDPGSPYAIGSELGGHTAIEPSLGSLDDFDHFVSVCRDRHIDVAMDFAIQCSPDHPWVKQHPEWFFHRPDGSIKFAENPPKKYQDIYPLDLTCDAYQSLWDELASVVTFWVEHGVKIFRVDNPHTKPVTFWAWFISSLKAKFPDLIFFAEAFTTPNMMKLLAKVGFTMSYTYFTWRNTKWELQQYLRELTTPPMTEFFRGNFFTNTPDILHAYLQTGGRPAFKVRAVLASTLSSLYGIYNGFELCENRALPGREEYADSEKYQYKVWDWDRPGNIKPLLTTLNRARNAHPALQEYDNLVFHQADHDNMLVYSKADPSHRDVILIAVNLDPFHTAESLVHVNLRELGLDDDDEYWVEDLISGNRWKWRGSTNYVRLDPQREPAHLFVVSPVHH